MKEKVPLAEAHVGDGESLPDYIVIVTLMGFAPPLPKRTDLRTTLRIHMLRTAPGDRTRNS